MAGTATAGDGRPRPTRPLRSRIPLRPARTRPDAPGGRQAARPGGGAGGNIVSDRPRRQPRPRQNLDHRPADDRRPRPAAPTGATHGDGVCSNREPAASGDLVTNPWSSKLSAERSALEASSTSIVTVTAIKINARPADACGQPGPRTRMVPEWSRSGLARAD